MSPARTAAHGLLLCALLASAACGTTVQTQAGPAAGDQALPSGGGDGLGGAASSLDGVDGASGLSPAGPGEVAPGGPGAPDAGGGGSGGTTSSGGGSSGGEVASPGGSGGTAPAPATGGGPAPGVTAKEIRIGFPTYDDEASTGERFGVKGFSSGDTRAQYKALADDLNKRGGLLGRTLVLVPRSISLAALATNPAAEEEAACTYWTQDEPVFAVLSPQFENLTPCLGRRGVTTVGGGGIVDGTNIARDRYVGASALRQDLLAPALIARLQAQNYFAGWNTALGQPGTAPARVGMIFPDSPTFQRYYAIISSELKARRIPFSEPVVYANTADGVAAASQSAVLRFSSDGVTHVFGAALLFFQAAESQGYRPRYAFDSRVPPDATAQNVGPEQLRGAMGVGYQPAWDVSAAKDPGDVSPQMTRCKKLMTAADINWKASRTTLYAVLSECDSLWSLEAAITRAGVAGADAVRAGFAGLGERDSALTFTSTWRPDRLVSASTVADLRYEDSCRCFAYGPGRTRI